MSEKESSKRIRLTVEGGPTREFSGDRTFVIGRSQHADFSIPHPNLSREHVRVSLKEGEVWMEDLGSANGTFVQGQRIPARSSVKIKPHYRVLLGTGSNVVLSFDVVDGLEPLPEPEPKGDVDLPTTRERTLAAITRNQRVRNENENSGMVDRAQTGTRERNAKMELDFPSQHFPHEVKKEKMADLRILEAKRQRVLEDIQYKEREVDDLRVKIRGMREESLKLKEQTENFKRDLAEQAGIYKREIDPLAARKTELEKCIQELDVIYEEKIDTLESGFRDLKLTLDESHSARIVRADKEFKEKTKRIDEEYANKLSSLEAEIESVRTEGEKLRDQLVREKQELEESLRKVRAEAIKLEADRKLEQVRIDTETAKLQGAKLKLENEIESIRLEREKALGDTQRLVEQGKNARAAREQYRDQTEVAKVELEKIRETIADIKKSESKNLDRIEELKSEIIIHEKNASRIKEVLREAEESAEKIRKGILDKAEEERQAIRKNAEAQAITQIQAAEAQAFARIQAAEAEAVARTQSAESQASAKIRGAETEALALTEKTQRESETLLSSTKSEVERLLASANLSGNTYYEEKKRLADELFQVATEKANELESGSKNHAERALADANAALESRRRSSEAEVAELKRRTEQEIRQIRANALADIESAKERESREFSQRLKSRAKSIADQIDRVVGSKLTAQFGINMDQAALKAFSNDVHQIVETVISPGKANGSNVVGISSEKTMSSIMTVDNQAQDRAIRYWKRLGLSAAIFFAFVMGKVVFPDLYSSIGKTIGMVLEVKDNTDAVVKRMLRERQLAMTFVTEQDQRIRDSYTDNILYTEAFIEMKEDIETQKVWTLGLNKFFQNELGLTEKAIVQFGSAEGRMVRELLEERKNLIPATSANGIAKMREIESGYVKEMRFVLRSDSNWQRYLGFQREFYSNYTQTLINRAPASRLQSQPKE